MERTGFIFYRSFYEAIKDLPRDIQGEVFTAIMEYGLNGITTENLKPVARAIFTLIKPQLDANNKKALGAKKGGNPNFKKGKPNPYYVSKKITKDNHEITSLLPKEKDKDKEKDKENIKVGIVATPTLPKNDNLLENRKVIFYNEVAKFSKKYEKETLRDFFDYWTEPNKSNSKMKFEMQKSWSLPYRLRTWAKNEENWGKKNKENGNSRNSKNASGKLSGRATLGKSSDYTEFT